MLPKFLCKHKTFKVIEGLLGKQIKAMKRKNVSRHAPVHIHTLIYVQSYTVDAENTTFMHWWVRFNGSHLPMYYLL